MKRRGEIVHSCIAPRTPTLMIFKRYNEIEQTLRITLKYFNGNTKHSKRGHS